MSSPVTTSRRVLRRAALVLLGSCLVASTCITHEEPTASLAGKPNILLIVTDDRAGDVARTRHAAYRRVVPLPGDGVHPSLRHDAPMLSCARLLPHRFVRAQPRHLRRGCPRVGARGGPTVDDPADAARSGVPNRPLRQVPQQLAQRPESRQLRPMGDHATRPLLGCGMEHRRCHPRRGTELHELHRRRVARIPRGERIERRGAVVPPRRVHGPASTVRCGTPIRGRAGATPAALTGDGGRGSP